MLFNVPEIFNFLIIYALIELSVYKVYVCVCISILLLTVSQKFFRLSEPG